MAALGNAEKHASSSNSTSQLSLQSVRIRKTNIKPRPCRGDDTRTPTNPPESARTDASQNKNQSPGFTMLFTYLGLFSECCCWPVINDARSSSMLAFNAVRISKYIKESIRHATRASSHATICRPTNHFPYTPTIPSSLELQSCPFSFGGR